MISFLTAFPNPVEGGQRQAGRDRQGRVIRSRQEIPGDKNWTGARAGGEPERVSSSEDRSGQSCSGRLPTKGIAC